MPEGISPENIQREKREGRAIPTIAEALQSDENLDYLAAEIGKVLERRPKDKDALMEALYAAEKYLNETDGLRPQELFKLIGANALGNTIGATIGTLVLSILFPPNALLAAGVAIAGTVVKSTMDVSERRSEKANARRRLRFVLGVLSDDAVGGIGKRPAPAPEVDDRPSSRL